ncbi:L-rhamnose mutarotase [Humibacter soli]
MKVALHSTLREGATADYRREHARVPDELRALFDRAGIRDWSIFRSGDRLFHVVDCEDFDAAMTVIRGDDADRRWQEKIGVYVDDFYGPNGEAGYLPLEQIWSLDEQRRADATLPDMGLD